MTLPEAVRRQSGSYYTPDLAASLMARWVMDRKPATVLEPSFGDGVFLAAVEQAAATTNQTPELGEAWTEIATEALVRLFGQHTAD